ncbi:MAG: Sua5/YciO/YrdC/YwlC family protein [Pseudomonadales bacterium]|nr:Sua5/YciO/YrdC/YwlC family protein [Pseudomonadales bacterium]
MVAYPTEAVWGLGCDPFNAEAVYALLALKQRPVEKGLILVAANWQQLSPYIEASVLTAMQEKPIPARPTTWLIPFKKGTLPHWIVGEHTTVAVRISVHRDVQALTLAFGGPIISTSANPAGCLPAKEIFHLRRYFALQLTICRGRIGHEERPSQIINGLTGLQLRD